jgi:hypothetical protein
VREFVAIKSPIDLAIEMQAGGIPADCLLKREALMFSRISSPFVEKFQSSMSYLGLASLNDLTEHLNYLQERSLLFMLPPSAEGAQLNLLESDAEFQTLRSVEQPLEQWILEAMRNAGLEELLDGRSIEPDKMDSYSPKIEPVVAPFIFTFQYYVRRMCVQLRVIDGMDAYPVISDIIPQMPIPQSQKCDVIDVTLNSLPIPDDTVPWEQIWEYRSDPDSQRKFLALRKWMSEMARAKLTPAEMEEELEYLLDDYRSHLRLHRLQTNTGALETIVIAVAEFLEDLANKRFSKIAKGFFSAKQRQIDLLQGEMNAPGREVAYIIKARGEFTAGP